jgi:hypothetical protein
LVACASECGKGRTEFTGCEGVESAETPGEFYGGQAAFAVERAEKIGCGAATFVGVAFDTAGDEVAVQIIVKFDARNDVVEAAHCGGEATAAVKVEAALTVVDGIARGAALQEVLLLKAGGVSGKEGLGSNSARTNGANLRGQADLDRVARLAAFDQAQDTTRDEAAHGPAHRVVRETSSASEPRNGKAQAKPTFEAAMAEEMRINDEIGGGEAETRSEVLKLLPHE